MSRPWATILVFLGQPSRIALTDAVNAQSILPDLMAETVTQGVDPAEAVSRATDRMAQIAEELGAFS